MGTMNFSTMKNFPLYARDFIQNVKHCPNCDTYVDEELDICPDCGAELDDVEIYDAEWEDEVCTEISHRMDALDHSLSFHVVHLKHGHYTGVQFYVDEQHDPNEYDNDDCHYYFGSCRSVAIRRYNSEIGKIKHALAILAGEFGFQQLDCTAIFANGTACYTKR